jgi:RNA polymerase sigma factor (sigma-70 family)
MSWAFVALALPEGESILGTSRLRSPPTSLVKESGSRPLRAAVERAERAMADWDAEEVAPGGEGFTHAYRSHCADLVRFLFRRLRCRSTAEDLAHEAYIRFAGAQDTVRNPRGFLFQIGANLAHNYLQQERRRAELREEGRDLLGDMLDELTPERQLLADDALRRVAAIIPSLPERTREILILSRLEGLNPRQIGERLGISGTAVEKHIRKALKRIVAAAEPADAPREKNPSPAVRKPSGQLS